MAETTPTPAPTFRDAAGRTWTLRLNVLSAMRVKTATGVDFLSIARDPAALANFAAGPEQVIKAAWALIQPDAEKLGVTEEQFLSSLDGDACDSLAEAMFAALTTFMPAKARGIFQKAEEHRREKAAEMEKTATQAMIAAVDKQCEMTKQRLADFTAAPATAPAPATAAANDDDAA